MAMNKIQFQKGLSLKDFFEKYGSDEKCEDELVKARWSDGWSCSRCGCERCSITSNGRKLWECLGCGYQSSSIVGTIFEHTKLGLSVWFLAIYLITQSKNGISALELKRQLGVSYKTAWLVKHKILQTMMLREEGRKLDDRVEMDDAYLGGEKVGKRGRGSENKTPFVVAVETREGRPIFIKLKTVSGFTKDALKKWAEKSLCKSAKVVSDGLWCFMAVAEVVDIHERHIVGGGVQSVKKPEFRWVNTVLGNIKTAIHGTYHSIKNIKYADRYLSEFSYRFNRRFDLPAMIPRLLYVAIKTIPHPMKILRLSEAGN